MTDPSIVERRRRAEKEHSTLDLVGLRAQGTAAGLIQLCVELRQAGILAEDAVQRIKQTIVADLSVSLPTFRRREEAEVALRTRIDAIFDRRMTAQDSATPVVGTSEDFGEAIGLASAGGSGDRT